MKKIFFLALSVLAIVSCSSSKSEDQQIQDYLKKKNWTAQVTAEGLYYIIDSTGTGTNPAINNTVTVKYKGYLLDETVFDQSTAGVSFGLAQVIQGWQIGIPKFKKGGKGKLLIPSSLGYGSSGAGSIPGNAPLVFEIELVSFK